MQDLRGFFPIFQKHSTLAYLDNAATTQKPEVVLEAMHKYYTEYCANVHRSMYALSEEATTAYEHARGQVAQFLNVNSKEIVFNAGSTDGLNQIVEMLIASGEFVQPRIVLGVAEHHANILPWQQWQNADLQFLNLTEDFQYDLSEIDEEVDIISLALVSNVTGAILDVAALKQRFPKAVIILDMAQAVAHMPIDLVKLGADFAVFSGHKLYGPTGVGVMWAKYSWLEKLVPARVGGGIIREVYRSFATWSDIPQRFEAGTPPIAEAIGLGAACEFLTELGWKQIQQHEKELSDQVLSVLNSQSNISIYRPQEAAGVFSFSIEGIHAHDIAYGLAQDNICVRAGHHCNQILHREVLKIPASARISLGIYNHEEDIEKLAHCLPSVVKDLTKHV